MRKAKKLRLILCIILAIMIIVALYWFLPKRIVGLISINSIERVECQVLGVDKTPFILSENEERELYAALKKVNYQLKSSARKCMGKVQYDIYYKNGHKSILKDYWFAKYDENGNKLKAIYYVSDLPIVAGR